MRVAVVSGNVPNATSSGGSLTAWSTIKSLAECGHAVTVFPILDTHSSASPYSVTDQIDALEALGVDVVPLAGTGPVYPRPRWKRLQSLIRPELSNFYPTARLAQLIGRHLVRLKPHGLFTYSFEPLAAVYGHRETPIVGLVGDPTHMPEYYRWRTLPLRQRISEFRSAGMLALRMLHVPSCMRQMLAACRVSAAQAAHHAEWFRRHGVPHCQYFRTPVADDGGPHWYDKRQAVKNSARFKLLLIGHLRGIATLSGLYLFAREILPILARHFTPDTLEIHVVGGHTPPADLDQLLQHPLVKRRGQIAPPDEEFLSADLQLVPTPIDLGMRVRIVTAFSFGCPVVAHTANALGIPELIHRNNCLLGRTGEELARLVIEVLQDRALRERIGQHGRKTYEACFALPVAGKRIVQAIEHAAA